MDDEQIDVVLENIPLSYDAIFFTASVFKAGGMADAAQDKGFQGRQQRRVPHVQHQRGRHGGRGRSDHAGPGGRANCCLIAKVSRYVGHRPEAPWQIEVLEEMVSITRGDINSLLEHCRQRV
jgi:hypothetical protein